jgi:hypothetical protein
MLFGPLLAGMIAGGFRLADILLVLSMLMVYLASNPLIQWLKQPSRKADMKKWAFGYSVAAALFGIPLVIEYPHLLWMALPASVSLLINIRFALRKQERHLLNDLAAIAGLCLGTVAAFYVGSGTFGIQAWYMWGAFVLQFFGSALYVKTLIREKGNRNVKMAANQFQGLLLFVSIVVGMVLPGHYPVGYLALAFLFSLVKVWVTPFNINLRPLTVGLIEIANTIWFTLIVGFIFR